MSGKQTKLDDLNVELSKEEEEIVDSIISELNGDEEPSKPPPQKRPSPQQMPPPQQIPPPQQMPPGQQGMPPPQQQQMPPNMMQQKMMEEQMKKEKVEELSMVDKIKRDIREPSIVMFLTLLMLLPQTNGILTSTKLSLFLNADGSISLYGLMVKALIAGILYFVIKKYT